MCGIQIADELFHMPTLVEGTLGGVDEIQRAENEKAFVLRSGEYAAERTGVAAFFLRDIIHAQNCRRLPA